MNTHTHYKGHCFCGAVEFTVKGEPALQGYCHCDSCRSWSASPLNAFTLWNPDHISVTQGQNNIERYAKTASSRGSWCKACGGHLFTHHPSMSLTDIFAAVIPEFPFKAALHMHYQERSLPVHDGLPKYKDLPEDAGGSGQTLSD